MRTLFAIFLTIFVVGCGTEGNFDLMQLLPGGKNPKADGGANGGGNSGGSWACVTFNWDVKQCSAKPIPYAVQTFEAPTYGQGKIVTDGEVFIGARQPCWPYPGMSFSLNAISYTRSAFYPNVTGYNGSTPVVRESLPQAVDPLANLALPDPNNLPLRHAGPAPLLISAPTELEPGRYVGGIQIFSDLTLKPGIYWIEGQIHFVGSGFRGTGVTIFQSVYETRDDFNMFGNTTIDLRSPETGPYAGLVYYQVRRPGACADTRYDPCSIIIQGNNRVNLEGVVHIAQSRFYADGANEITLRKLISGLTVLHSTTRLTALRTTKPELLGCLP